MYFRMLHDDASGSVSYLLADLESAQAVLIDPRGTDVPLLRAMLDEHRLALRWVLRTHEHDALLPRADVAALAALGAPRVLHQVPDDTLLPFGDEHVEVLATPGHTSGCLSFRWRDRLFCGGLLAVDACPFQPRPADPRALWDSVTQQVFQLPDETLLFAGHAHRGRAASTVFEQRRWHPWFGTTSRDDFLARVAALPATRPEPTLPNEKPHARDSLRLRH
jgi:glyoxylase-like metal-dependent hydrolase (beta-lactamase superfamily II)